MLARRLAQPLLRPLMRPVLGVQGLQRSFAQTVASWYDTGAPGRFVPTYRDWATSGALFQDAAGTQPVTALEQFVGLNLDRSRNLIRGDERVPDPGFDNPAAWNFSGSAPGWVVSGGQASVTAAAAGNRWIACGPRLTVGRTYEVFFDLTVTSGGCLPDFSTTPSFATTSGRKRWVLTATAATLQVIANPAFVGTIDNITVKEIPGNHRVQPTATSRPILTARKNWLFSTENFQGIGWVKRGAFVSTGGQADPLGGTGAALWQNVNPGAAVGDIYFSGTNIAAGVRNEPSFWIKRSSTVGQISLETASGAGNGRWLIDVALLPDEWSRITRTNPAVTVTTEFVGTGTVNSGIFVHAANGSPVLSFYFFGPQQELGTTTGRYQRVNTATDYDAVGFPVGLRYDGIDDCMYTAAPIDYSGTDKVTLIAPVQKASDAATGVMWEHGSSSNANAGTWEVGGPAGNGVPNYGAQSRGATTLAVAALAGSPAPTSDVITAVFDIAAPLVSLSKNSDAPTNVTTAQGGGNFTSQVNNEGARNNSSLRYSGVLLGEMQIGNFRTADEMAYVKAQFAKNLSEVLA